MSSGSYLDYANRSIYFVKEVENDIIDFKCKSPFYIKYFYLKRTLSDYIFYSEYQTEFNTTGLVKLMAYK